MFDKIYCINLDRRADRWEQFQRDYPAELLPAERWRAEDGNKISCGWWRGGRGAYGCFASHLAIIEKCIADNTATVLIFEDDAVARDGFAELWSEFVNLLPSDWEWIYFGGWHRSSPPRRVNPGIYVPQSVGGTHAYALRLPTMIKLRDLIIDRREWHRRRVGHIDHFYERLTVDGWPGLYCPAKWLFWQAAGKSDISGGSNGLNTWPDPYTIREKPHGTYVPTEITCDPAPCGADQFCCKRRHCHQSWPTDSKPPVCRERRLIRQEFAAA